MRSVLMSLTFFAVSSAAFAGSGSYREVTAPTSGVSCQLANEFSASASLNTKDYGYDVVKDVSVFNGIRNQKLFLGIFDNHDQTIDINMTLDGANTHVYGVKVPKAGQSPFHPDDATKTMAVSVLNMSGLELYCVSK